MSTSKVSNKVIVLDLECTADGIEPFPNDTTEIIEIGFCLYDMATKDISDKTSIIVKPDVTKISQFCEDLTGITQHKVDTEGISLKDANDILITKFKSHKRIVACYGRDVIFMVDECNRKGIQTPFWLGKAFDIHTLYKLKTGSRRKSGLTSALERYNLEFEGLPHSGADDAWNTAKLLRELLK